MGNGRGVSIGQAESRRHTSQIRMAGNNLEASVLSVIDEVSTIDANERSRIAFNSFQTKVESVGQRLVLSANQIQAISSRFAGIEQGAVNQFNKGIDGHTGG